MSLHQKLQQRAAERRPIRVGLIGAGKFGAMYLATTTRACALRREMQNQFGDER